MEQIIGVIATLVGIFSTLVALVVYLVKSNSKERRENTDRYIDFLSEQNKQMIDTNQQFASSIDKMSDSIQSLSVASSKTGELMDAKTKILQDHYSVLQQLVTSVQSLQEKTTRGK